MLKPLFLGLAMATLVTACTEDYTDWAKPQTHPQDESQKLTVVVDGANAIDMNVLDKSAKVEVLKATVTGAPRSAFSYKLMLTPSEGLLEKQVPAVLIADSLGQVSVEELEKAVTSFYGIAPRQRTLNAKVSSLADFNGESYRIGTESGIAVRFTPIAQSYSETMDVLVGGKTISALGTRSFDGYYDGFLQTKAPFTLQYTHQKQAVVWNASNFLLLDGNFEADAQQNITAPKDALYYLKVERTPAGDYKLIPTEITRVALSGTLNGWGDTPMTYNATEDCWEVTTDFVDGEFKFRFNGNWDINLGGWLEELSSGSPNMTSKKGKYLVRLYLNRKDGKPLHATLTAK